MAIELLSLHPWPKPYVWQAVQSLASSNCLHMATPHHLTRYSSIPSPAHAGILVHVQCPIVYRVCACTCAICRVVLCTCSCVIPCTCMHVQWHALRYSGQLLSENLVSSYVVSVDYYYLYMCQSWVAAGFLKIFISLLIMYMYVLLVDGSRK